ncbi:MAG: GGDEF domain-containing protein [Bradymonadales bacterium]|nr:MAG: GGDEF domain-containing protein [Bradymonadales bacterium]
MDDEQDQTTSIASIAGEIPAESEPFLIVLTGTSAGRSIKLDSRKEWMLGRASECDLVFQEGSISRNHCRIVQVNEDQWQLVDLGSSNGTWVNGDKIKDQILEKGDKIQLGSSTVLKFVLQDEFESNIQKELYESATRDSLMGIASKRHFSEQLDIEFQFHRRTKKPLSVVMGDIDHFKKTNDTYGHLAGDQILRDLGIIMRNLLRKGDVAGRYGGEEVVFLLRETSLPGAKSFAERLRQVVEGHSFLFEGKKIPTTLSLGVATLQNDNFKTPKDLIKKADEYLYEAKKAGRNRVHCLIDGQ